MLECTERLATRTVAYAKSQIKYISKRLVPLLAKHLSETNYDKVELLQAAGEDTKARIHRVWTC